MSLSSKPSWRPYASRFRTLSDPTVEIRELRPADLLREGFHARLNREALDHTPVVYLIRNDGYADGVPLPLAFANPCLIDLAPAYRLRGARATAETLDAVLNAAKASCLAGHGPFILEHIIPE